MRRFTFIYAMAVIGAAAYAQQVTSPNGKLVIDVDCIEGKPTYNAHYWGVEFLKPSPLGLVADIGDFTQGLTLLESAEPIEVSGSYSLPNIKKSQVDYKANQRTYTFGRDGKPVMDVTFVVEDCDFAFKYKLYPQGDRTCTLIEREATGYVLPDGTTTFLCPQTGPMVGWKRTMPSYETKYQADAPMGANGQGYGFTFPCLFKHNDQGWIMLSETGVDGNYCASHLDNGGGSLYVIDYPEAGEMNGAGTTGAEINLPGETPWRTVTFGHSLRPITMTTIPFDVVTPKYQPSKDYAKDYGKGTWSWIIRQDPSCNFDEQKEYIDFAADMGYESVLVDALWDTQIGYEGIEELARYGKSKGVDLYLWYNSNGNWNDAPQGPRGKMDRVKARRDEMAWMQANGIRGIKVDFFGGDKQEMMKLYEDILSDANDYGLMVIFHGCTIPKGWERMYPNYVASEAVLASENLNFSQQSCDEEAFCATIHPVLRNTIGSMDFGGSTLNRYYNKGNKEGGSRRVTSDVFALATAVMFQSPVQHFALAPNNLTDAPDWAIQFMKDVPTTWDDVKFIEGYPGKYLIMTRRHGDKWYVVGINAQAEPVKTRLSLAPYYDAGTELTVYSDDAKLDGSVKQVKLNKKQELEVTIPQNGGVVILNAAQ